MFVSDAIAGRNWELSSCDNWSNSGGGASRASRPRPHGIAYRKVKARYMLPDFDLGSWHRRR